MIVLMILHPQAASITWLVVMKHKLNLNGPGSRLLGTAMLMIGFSILIHGLAWLLERFSLRVAWLKSLALIWTVAGAILLLVLAVLLVIEALQDRAMDMSYRKQRSHPMPIGNGYYECQYCGNRMVHKGDRICSVCDRELD